MRREFSFAYFDKSCFAVVYIIHGFEVLVILWTITHFASMNKPRLCINKFYFEFF